MLQSAGGSWRFVEFRFQIFKGINVQVKREQKKCSE
jgi:hypothetical protein